MTCTVTTPIFFEHTFNDAKIRFSDRMTLKPAQYSQVLVKLATTETHGSFFSPTSSVLWPNRKPPFSEYKEFQGLAAILASYQELAVKSWGLNCLVKDVEQPLTLASDSFLSNLKAIFTYTVEHLDLQEWLEYSCQLAKEYLTVQLEKPIKVQDPENESAWWFQIVARCHGSVNKIFENQTKMTKFFVSNVPAEAREKIRFEIIMED